MSDKGGWETRRTVLPEVLETVHEVGKEGLGAADLVGVVHEARVRAADGRSVAIGGGQPQLGDKEASWKGMDHSRMNIVVEDTKKDVRVTSDNFRNLEP